MSSIQPVQVLRIEETQERMTIYFAIGKIRAKTRCALERAALRSARRLAFGELEGFSDAETRRGCRVSIPTLPEDELFRRIRKCLGGVEAAIMPSAPKAAPVAVPAAI